MKKYNKGQIVRKGMADIVSTLSVDSYKPYSRKGMTSHVIKEKNFTLDSYPQDKGIYRFCISSESIDRDGEIVIQKGIKYEDYVKNPVVFWGHEWGSVPIGKVISVTYVEEESKTYADVIFGSTPKATEIETLVKEGIVQATSIGFRINDWDYSDDLDALLFTETELLELSIVGLPANQDAVGGNEVDAPGEGKSLGKIETEYTIEVGEKGYTVFTPTTDVLKDLTVEQVQEMIAAAVAEAVAETIIQPADPKPAGEPEPSKEDDKEPEVTASEPEAATLEEQLAALEARLLDALQNINGENGDGKDPEPEDDKSDEQSGSEESDEEPNDDDSEEEPAVIIITE